MPSIPGKPTPIEATLINAAVASAAEAPAELKAAREAAQTDGNHNLVVVDNSDTENQKVYNLKVSEMQLDGVELGQKVSTGKIQGTIRFMDHGGDDVKAAAPAARPSDPAYDLSTQQAAETIRALAVWAEGSRADEAPNFRNDYSPREHQEVLDKFQQEIGAEPSGRWDEQTFVKAKAFVREEYGRNDAMTDNQFKSFLADLRHYHAGALTYDEINENFDGYLLDLRNEPVHVPTKPDKAGFEALLKSLSADDKLLLPLALDGYDPEEAKGLIPILRGQTPAAEARAYLLEEFGDAEDMPGVMAPGANVGKELGKQIFKEMQADGLDMKAAECSGEFDQKTYDALRKSIAQEHELDKNSPQLAGIVQAVLKDMLAYTKGEIDKDQLNERLDKLVAK